MVRQLEEGLVLCGLLERIRNCSSVFKPLFVEDDTFVITPDKLLDNFNVHFSERQHEKMKESTTYKHFCDFIEEL